MTTNVAISGIPFGMDVNELRSNLKQVIKAYFKLIYFDPMPKGNKKIIYLKLGAKVNAKSMLNTINSNPWIKNIGMRAYFPSYHSVPRGTPLPGVNKFKKQQQPNKYKKMKEDEKTTFAVLSLTFQEIMTEVQSKFSKLYNLSQKTDHKLLEEISWQIYDRLKQIKYNDNEKIENCFVLSKAYRWKHPHHSDYKFIMNTLHSIQDATGVPRTQFTEAELCTTVKPAILDELPYDVVSSIARKYSTEISNAICNYVKNINCMPQQLDSKEDVARKKVQEQLKKMLPNLEELIKKTTNGKIVPSGYVGHRCRIYGEPFLPTRDVRDVVLKPCFPKKMQRSDRIYNMIKFTVPIEKYEALMALDGKELGGAKIRIRSSDIPLYKYPAILADMRRNYGNEKERRQADVEDTEDDEENWESISSLQIEGAIHEGSNS